MILTTPRKTHLTRNGHAAHNPPTQADVDANRDLSLQSQRVLSERLRRATALRGWWGRVTVSVLIEDGQIRTVEDSESRTHKHPVTVD